jgi:hypothetical protein
VSIASLAAAMFAATAQAAPDARLGGDFKMNGKITSSRGFGTEVGERVTRIYKFRPRCASGPCDVTFRRQSADGFRKSIARRVNPGVYKAVDRVRGAPCTSGGRVVGRQPVTTQTKITITRGADGDATKIAVKLLVTAPKSGKCSSARQTASLTGSLR